MLCASGKEELLAKKQLPIRVENRFADYRLQNEEVFIVKGKDIGKRLGKTSVSARQKIESPLLFHPAIERFSN